LLLVERKDGTRKTNNQQSGTSMEQQILAFSDEPELMMNGRREERRRV
jgi:hypothetical protein